MLSLGEPKFSSIPYVTCNKTEFDPTIAYGKLYVTKPVFSSYVAVLHGVILP
jgi:hypothetical protein